MRDRLLRLLILAARLLTSPFVRYEFRGGKCVLADPGRAWVLSGNHRSGFDFLLAMVGLVHFGVAARIMIASEFFERPPSAWIVKAVNAIPVYRASDPQAALAAAISTLKEGHSLCIMPEGRVHFDPDRPLAMGPAKSGVSRLAVSADAPVIAIALIGTERVWPEHAQFPRFWRRQAVICRLADEPLWLEGDDHRANTAVVVAATEALMLQATRDLQEIDPTYMPGVEA